MGFTDESSFHNNLSQPCKGKEEAPETQLPEEQMPRGQWQEQQFPNDQLPNGMSSETCRGQSRSKIRPKKEKSSVRMKSKERTTTTEINQALEGTTVMLRNIP